MKQAIIVMALLVAQAIPALGKASQRRVTSSEVKMITQAVEDEVYDYGFYSSFYQIGENIGSPKHWVARVQIFVNPYYNDADQYGEVIYKLMPFGEIYRLYDIDSGRIRLDGDPDNHFPITQPSHQTVFMDEADVCSFESRWLKAAFVVDTAPPADVIQGAAERQKARKGFSVWEYEHKGRK